MTSVKVKCSVDECDKARGARRGLCDMHYERQRIASKTEQCSSLICEKVAITRGFCYGHYSRLRAGQPIDTPLFSRRSSGTATRRNSDGLRGCLRCKGYFPDTNFHKGSSVDGLAPSCVECTVDYRYLKYGITSLDYARMFEEQGGLCKICKEPPGARALSVDHDHDCCPGGSSCGECVRGLLCGKCNSGIGLFNENEEILMSAIRYIADHREG